MGNNNSHEIVSFLIGEGEEFDINDIAYKNVSYLAYALDKKKQTSIEICLRFGADPNIENQDLSYAFKIGCSPGIIRIMLEYGAKVSNVWKKVLGNEKYTEDEILEIIAMLRKFEYELNEA